MEEFVDKSIFEEEISIIYGGFWERFGALILDYLILLPLTLLNAYNSKEWKSSILLVIVALLLMTYKPLLEYLYGATPGKKALSLIVVTDSYKKISGKEAILRNIFDISISLAGVAVSLYTLPTIGQTPKAIRSLADINPNIILSSIYGFIALLIYLADAICLLSNPRKKAIHDFIGKTLVIRKG